MALVWLHRERLSRKLPFKKVPVKNRQVAAATVQTTAVRQWSSAIKIAKSGVLCRRRRKQRRNIRKKSRHHRAAAATRTAPIRLLNGNPKLNQRLNQRLKPRLNKHLKQQLVR